MSKPLDERVKKILKELELDPKECLWDCNGTWVMYHRYIEIAGAKHNIVYDLYEAETNSINKCVAIKCVASIKPDLASGDSEFKTVTTYGEASPSNNKNAYPYAMAEKRAVDRAILKLLGLHGFIYSEDEMPPEKDKRISPAKELAKDNTAEETDYSEQMAIQVKRLIDNGEEWKAHDLVYSHDNEIRTGIWNALGTAESDIKGGNGKNLLYRGVVTKCHKAEENGERETDKYL